MTKERKSTITLSKGATLVDPIPWDEIDPEIEPLVRLLNKQPGIRTLYSCAGHNSDSYSSSRGIYGYVTMTIDTLDNLICLVRKLGIKILTGWLTEDRLSEAYIECRELHDDDNVPFIVFTLHIKGQPLWVQRKKLMKIEKALKNGR